MQGMYRTPLMEVSTKCVLTNTTQVTAYRGAGRPEGNYYMERLIDAAAAEMGIDRVELRRRNHISPQELPLQTAHPTIYDSGDFPALSQARARARRQQGLCAAQARKQASAASCAAWASAATWK